MLVFFLFVTFFFPLCFKFITGHITDDDLLVCDQVTQQKA